MNALILAPRLDELKVSVSDEVKALAVESLASVKAVQQVTNGFELDVAVQVVQEADMVCRDIEDSRKTVKAPVLLVGNKIDQLCHHLTDPLLAEVQRVKRLAADWQLAQQRIAEEAERKRQAELAKIEEAKRKLEAPPAEDHAEGWDQIAQQADANAAELKILNERAAAIPAVQAPAAPEAVSSVKAKWTFTVVDLAAVYAIKPAFVSLVENRRIIQNSIDAGLRECPGLKIFQEAKMTFRRGS